MKWEIRDKLDQSKLPKELFTLVLMEFLNG